MAQGRYFEDYNEGDVIETGGMTVTETQIIDFARIYDPQSFHVDVVAAETSMFQGLAASGFQTLSLTFRLACDTGIFQGTNLGSGGGEGLRWLKPVRPGDTLSAKLEVIEVRPSSSRTDRGNVRMRYRTFNQHGEEVMQITFHHLVKCRNAS
jgi:acyl dehydratase